jgi:transketolase N-terminal domain/subunit
MNDYTIQILQLSLEMLADTYARSMPTGSVISLARILGEKVAPRWQYGDVLIVSKAHACAAEYAFHVVVSHQMSEEEARSYGKPDGLETHSSRLASGVPFTLGSLGMGLPLAVGLAMADPQRQVWCVVGDAECQSGATLEIFDYIKLDNLTVIIDANGAGACQELYCQEGEDTCECYRYDKNSGLGGKLSRINAHYQPINRGDIPYILTRLEAEDDNE